MGTGQIKSRQRVSEFGEVYTAHRQVTDMLDLIPADMIGIDTTYFEPACGNGNFIAEILRRKIMLIDTEDSWTFSLQLLRRVASVYGVDIQQDNVCETVDRIAGVAEKAYIKAYHCALADGVRRAVRSIALRNIVCGNTLTAAKENGEELAFHEWDIRDDGIIRSKEYTLSDMLQHDGVGTTPIRTHTYRWLVNSSLKTA